MCKTGSGKLRNTDAGSRVQRSGRGAKLNGSLDVRERRKDCMHFVEDACERIDWKEQKEISVHNLFA